MGRALGPARALRRRGRELHDAARRRHGGRRLRRQPDAGHRLGDGARRRRARRRALRRRARRDHPRRGDERGRARRLAARVLDGHAPPDARRHAAAAPALPHAVPRDPGLLRDRRARAAPRPGRLPRRDLRLRGDALVLDGAPRAAAAARRAARTTSGRTAARAGCASAATTCRRSRCSGLAGTASSLLVVSVLDLQVAAGRHRLAAARAWPPTSSTAAARASTSSPRTRSRSPSRSSTTRRSTTPCCVHVGDGRFDAQLLATAAKLAARKRRGIHVLVTITVPHSHEIDARDARGGGRGGVRHRAGPAAGRPPRLRATGRRSARARRGGGSSRRRRTCAPPPS